jgi:hypothetical protein
LSDDNQRPSITESCACGGRIEVSVPDALDIVREWRFGHRHDLTDKRQGLGFAATSTASSPNQPWGHNNLNIRA